MEQEIEIFISYSHKDEKLRNALGTHLSLLERRMVVKTWHDRKIGVGEEWKGKINKQLENASIILLLISADFLNSDYCYDLEMRRALERHKDGSARVIPVILRPVDRMGAPFDELQALPKDAKPVTKWSNRDEAFVSITEGVRKIAEELIANRNSSISEVKSEGDNPTTNGLI